VGGDLDMRGIAAGVVEVLVIGDPRSDTQVHVATGRDYDAHAVHAWNMARLPDLFGLRNEFPVDRVDADDLVGDQDFIRRQILANGMGFQY